MNYDLKVAIETYFIENWTDTSIQFEGEVFDYEGLDEWISLKFIPVSNDMYAFGGSGQRVVNNSQLQVFCYAKQVPYTYDLMKSVSTFLNSVQLGNIYFNIGQDRAVIDLSNGFFEGQTIFEVNNFN